MSFRKKCEKSGHKWDMPIEMISSPYVFCSRWGCSASAVSKYADPRIAAMLHNAIPWEDRVPQVEIPETPSK